MFVASLILIEQYIFRLHPKTRLRLIFQECKANLKQDT